MLQTQAFHCDVPSLEVKNKLRDQDKHTYSTAPPVPGGTRLLFPALKLAMMPSFSTDAMVENEVQSLGV